MEIKDPLGSGELGRFVNKTKPTHVSMSMKCKVTFYLSPRESCAGEDHVLMQFKENTSAV